MKWEVVSVEPKENYLLLITFKDKSKKIFDLKPLFDIEMYKVLKDKGLFNKCKVKNATVVWNEDVDLCPEMIYEEGVDYELVK